MKIEYTTQNITVLMLGLIAIADLIAITVIPHLIEYESVVLALILIINTIVGGFIGFLQNKPHNTETSMEESINDETGNETP